MDLVQHSSDFNFSIAVIHNSSEYILLEEDLRQDVFYFIQNRLDNQLNNSKLCLSQFILSLQKEKKQDTKQ